MLWMVITAMMCNYWNKLFWGFAKRTGVVQETTAFDPSNNNNLIKFHFLTEPDAK